MKMLDKEKMRKIASLILTFAFLFFAASSAQADFNPPGSAPPAGNAASPIYSVGDEQLTGSLTVTAASGAAMIGQGGTIGIQGNNSADGNGVFGNLTAGGAGGGKAIYGLAVDANDYAAYLSGGLGLGIAANTDISFVDQGSGISWPRESPGGAWLYGIMVDTSGQLQLRGHGAGIAFQDQTPATKMVILENGNVGIGTTGPGSKLQVAGTSAEYVRIGLNSNYASLVVGTQQAGYPFIGMGVKKTAADNNYIADTDDNVAVGHLALEIGTNNFRFKGATHVADDSAVSMADLLNISNNGNVGIGTAPTGYKLDVQGAGAQINVSGGLCINGDCKTLWSQVAGTSQWTDVAGGINYSGGKVGIGDATPDEELDVESTGEAFIRVNSDNDANSADTDVGIDLLVDAGTQKAFWHYDQGLDRVLFGAGTANNIALDSAGNVGIGTTNPSLKLVVRDSASKELQFDGNEVYAQNELFLKSTSGNDIIMQPGAATAVTFKSGGNVGIGTTGLNEKLEVDGGAPTRLRVTDTTASENPEFQLKYNTGASDHWAFYVDKTAGANKLKLWGAGATGADRVTVDTSGNVGIGVDDPQGYKLWVQGNEKIAGNLSITGSIDVSGADVAEEFRADRIYEPGTVLVIGDSDDKSAKISNQEYDGGVIGVVSSDASVVIGKIQAEKKAVVAMIGVVKVKVAGYNGAIKKGDLLTTSGVAGYAMKATKIIPGTIIGKALQDFSGSKGEILVLVNLQ